MNSKPFIPLLVVLFVLVGFADRCLGEDGKTALTVEKISFAGSEDGTESITLSCNQSCTPELFSLEAGNPRVVMDLKGVSSLKVRSRTMNTGGKLVKRVRNYLDKQTNILRVVLDLEQSGSYVVLPMQDRSGNAYALTLKKDTDSSAQGRNRITIIRTPGVAQRAEASAPPRPPEPRAKDTALVDQGRAQLNAGEFAAAVTTFTKNLAAHPQDSLSYRLRGNAHDNLGERQNAIKDWTKAAKLGDTIVQSYLDFLKVKWR